MSISETGREVRETPKVVEANWVEGQREDETSLDFLSRLGEEFRRRGGRIAILELPPDFSTDSNRVGVIHPGGEFLFRQRPEESFSDFCARMGIFLNEKGISTSFFVSDRLHENSPIGVVVTA